MRYLIILLCWMLAAPRFPVQAQNTLLLMGAGASSGGGGGPTYTYSEDFEGATSCTAGTATNPNSCSWSTTNVWATDDANVAANFGSTSAPLVGSHSLELDGTSAGGWHVNITGTTHVYGFFEFEFVGGGVEDFFNARDAGGAEIWSMYPDSGAANALAVWDGSAAHVSGFILALTTHYYVWWEYATGSGSGIIKVYISTTTTKPAATVSITTGTFATSVAQINFRANGGTQLFDHIRLSASDITVYP